MGQWQEMNDFSAWDCRISCVLCKEESEKTLVGEHWKCSSCDHLFNQDGTPLPEGVCCYCEKCCPRDKKEKTKSKLLSKVKKVIKKVMKKKV